MNTHASEGLDRIIETLRERPNVLITASTQSGKSKLAMSLYIAPDLEQGDIFLSINDPARTLGRESAAYALFLGKEDTLVIDDLTRSDGVVPLLILGRSDAPDPDVREAENSEFAEQFAESIGLISGVDIQTLITVIENSLYMARLWQNQNPAKHQLYLPYALRPGAKQFEEMVRDCTDDEARYKADTLRHLSRSATEFRKLINPTERRIEKLFNDPTIRHRIQPVPDFEPLVREKGAFITLGGDTVSRAAQSFIMRARNQSFSRIAKRNWAIGQQPTPMRLISDEWPAARLLGLTDVENLFTTSKMQCTYVWIGQTDDTGEEKMTDDFRQNCPEHVWMFSASQGVAARAAKDLQGKLNPRKVKRTRTTTRTLLDGYDEIRQLQHGVTIGHDGKRSRSERTAVNYRPRHREVTDSVDDYEALSEQNTMLEVDVMSLGKGWYYLKQFGSVSGPLYCEMTPDPWTFPGLAADMIDEHFRWQLAHGVTLPPAKFTDASACLPKTTAAGNRARPFEKRKAEIFAILSEHAMTADQIIAWVLCDADDQAAVRREELSRWLRHQRANGELFSNASVLLHATGRPTVQWSRGWIVPANRGAHEYWLTESLFTLDADETRRQAVNPAILADGECVWHLPDGSERWYIEQAMGLGSMTFAELERKRFCKYADSEDPVLWICHGSTPACAEDWMRRLMRRSGVMRDPFFTTTQRLIGYGGTAGSREVLDRHGNPAWLPERPPETLP